MREEATTRPSPRAVQRLADDVGGEVADLRAALRHALIEADRHEAEGRPDRAAAVLAEQQRLLTAVHQRLEDRLAEAAVEREAEGVVQAVAPTRPTSVSGGPSAVAGVSDHDGGMALRLLASAAAAIVGVALLAAPDGGGMLTAADSAGIEEGASTDDEGVAHGAAEPGAPAAHRPGPYPGAASAPSPSSGGEFATPAADGRRSSSPSDDPDADPQADPDDRVPSGLVDPGEVGEVLDRLDDVPAVEQGADTADETDASDDDQDAEQSEGSEDSWRPRDLAREDEESADPER